MDDLHAWCALWRVPRVGSRTYQKILKVFGQPKTFFSLSKSEREKVGIKADNSELTLALNEAEKDIAWLDNPNSNIITSASADYPKQLLNIPDYPPILFVRGDKTLLSQPQIAIVGSRSASHEGIDNAKLFASYLASSGLVVTSGLALGIDSAAHSGALLQGETIAVMGTGADRIYPAKNKTLAHAIVDKGLLVTEFSIGTPVKPESFPRRNRLISGLSLGVLVVEASLKSGSLITAKLANEQGKEVFSIPGSIHNPQAKGCNLLIKNGAKLVESGADIFEEIKSQLISYIADPSKPAEVYDNKILQNDLAQKQKQNTMSFADDPKKQALWGALTHSPQSMDAIIMQSQLPTNEVSSMLLIMELEGWVVKSVGGHYQKSTTIK